MKNRDILLLDQELPNLSLPDMDRWFNYAVQETIERAATKAKSIRKVIEPKPRMVEHNDKLKELQKKHANKNEFDEPILKVTDLGNGRRLEVFDIPEVNNPKSEFNLAVESLKDEYADAIEEYKDGLKFLDEDNFDFEPHWVTIDQIPNGMSRTQMSAVFLMIKKEEPKA